MVVWFWVGEVRNRFCGKNGWFLYWDACGTSSHCAIGSFYMGLALRREVCLESDLGWLAWKHHRKAPLKRILGAGLKPNIHGGSGDQMSIKCCWGQPCWRKTWKSLLLLGPRFWLVYFRFFFFLFVYFFGILILFLWINKIILFCFILLYFISNDKFPSSFWIISISWVIGGSYILF